MSRNVAISTRCTAMLQKRLLVFIARYIVALNRKLAICHKWLTGLASLWIGCSSILPGGNPEFFLGGGAFVSCSTSTPIYHSFFLQNTSCIKKPQVISAGGGCAPPAPSPRSAPDYDLNWSFRDRREEDRRSVAQQCWIRLHSSSNVVGAAHAHYAWFTKTYGLYPFHDALQVPTRTPLPTRTQP